MKSLKKSIITLSTAVALASSSVSPVMDMYNVYATSNAKISIKNLSFYSEGEIKYTGKPVSFKLHSTDDYDYTYSKSEYNILGYITVDESTYKYDKDNNLIEKNIPSLYDDSKWTKGIPTDIGKYVILFEGNGSYTGRNTVDISIIDINNISNFTPDSTYRPLRDIGDSDYILTPKDVCFELYYHDPESKKDYILLEEDKDYVFAGWCDYDKYNKSDKQTNVWSKEKITEKGHYVFKFLGIGKYKGEQILDYNVPDPYHIESYNFNRTIKYNKKTKKYEHNLFEKYGLIEGKDYKTSYTVSGKKKWKKGMPKKKGFYDIRIKGINKYHGTGFLANDFNNIKVLKKKTLKLSGRSLNNINVVICPKKTKKYTIYATSKEKKHLNIDALLYDENGDCIEGDLTDSKYFSDEKIYYGKHTFKITYKLEAGKVYHLDISCYNDSNKKRSFNVNIKKSYKYRKPKKYIKK